MGTPPTRDGPRPRFQAHLVITLAVCDGIFCNPNCVASKTFPVYVYSSQIAAIPVAIQEEECERGEGSRVAEETEAREETEAHERHNEQLLHACLCASAPMQRHRNLSNKRCPVGPDRLFKITCRRPPCNTSVGCSRSPLNAYKTLPFALGTCYCIQSCA